jgi:regulator of protease activity HflC (stomatin/prohibitin superfamily)|nr:MAG TPA: hypothetical protein [Caudoviricetes sp.]
MRPTLIADGGEMTVGRRTSTYVYGVFQVDIPEGREQAQQDDRLQEGYIYRPDQRPTGRFDIGFVRADARIDLNAQQSNLESIVDAAQNRVEGAVFFERDITGRGLGKFRPGVDFTTASLVDVLIWGKTLALPVTAIDMTSGDAAAVGWRAHVGGQMIADADSLRSHNDAILGQIEQERRRRLATTKTAETAATTANSATSAAATANTKAASAAAAADDADKKAKEADAAARIADQKAKEADQAARAADRKAIEALQTTVQGMPRILHIDTGGANIFTGSSGRINNGEAWGTLKWFSAGLQARSGARFEAKGDWTGSILMIAVATQGATDVSCADITAGNRYHESATGGIFQTYKSATVIILPST